jgi:hypothetical protein
MRIEHDGGRAEPMRRNPMGGGRSKSGAEIAETASLVTQRVFLPKKKIQSGGEIKK